MPQRLLKMTACIACIVPGLVGMDSLSSSFARAFKVAISTVTRDLCSPGEMLCQKSLLSVSIPCSVMWWGCCQGYAIHDMGTVKCCRIAGSRAASPALPLLAETKANAAMSYDMYS